MRNGAVTWALGLALSVVLHLGAGVGLLAALQPEPIRDQPMPESRLSVQAQDVTRSDAAEQAAPSEAAPAEAATGTSLGAGAIAQSTARPLAPRVQRPAAQDAQSTATVVAAAAAPSMSEAALTPPVTIAAVATSPTVTLEAAQAPRTAPIEAASPPRTATRKAALPPSTAAAPVTPDTARAAPANAKPVDIAALNPPGISASPRQPEAEIAPPATPEMTTGKAVLAFPSEGAVDPVSLAAFQSFTQPQEGDTSDLRDNLTSALSVPCARMQVTFDPDTTSLQVTGHIPDADQRGPVLAALRDQMGADIEVTDNLLILPAPQCGALTGIAGVGLPQSTDQITNPLIVGADTHARAFRFVKDRPLVIEMGGPDYPAYVYLDYFDADGNVIHLSPNDRAPLQRVAAKEQILIGARGPEEPGLYVLVGPPYGQEIAAAFAASVPLYEENRPLVEPAAPYLEWLKTRVAAARETHPDFKGEWVYFFVTTAEE